MGLFSGLGGIVGGVLGANRAKKSASKSRKALEREYETATNATDQIGNLQNQATADIYDAQNKDATSEQNLSDALSNNVYGTTKQGLDNQLSAGSNALSTEKNDLTQNASGNLKSALQQILGTGNVEKSQYSDIANLLGDNKSSALNAINNIGGIQAGDYNTINSLLGSNKSSALNAINNIAGIQAGDYAGTNNLLQQNRNIAGQGYSNSINAINTALANQQQLQNPYIQSGQSANTALMNLLGLGSDSAAQAYTQFMNNPEAQYEQSQAQDAINRSAASKGGLFSGATGVALSRDAQARAALNYNNYLQQLAGVASSGQNASNTLGNDYGAWSGSTQAQNNSITGILNGINNQQAQNLANYTNNQVQNQQSINQANQSYNQGYGANVQNYGQQQTQNQQAINQANQSYNQGSASNLQNYNQGQLQNIAATGQAQQNYNNAMGQIGSNYAQGMGTLNTNYYGADTNAQLQQLMTQYNAATGAQKQQLAAQINFLQNRAATNANQIQQIANENINDISGSNQITQQYLGARANSTNSIIGGIGDVANSATMQGLLPSGSSGGGQSAPQVGQTGYMSPMGFTTQSPQSNSNYAASFPINFNSDNYSMGYPSSSGGGNSGGGGGGLGSILGLGSTIASFL